MFKFFGNDVTLLHFSHLFLPPRTYLFAFTCNFWYVLWISAVSEFNLSVKEPVKMAYIKLGDLCSCHMPWKMEWIVNCTFCEKVRQSFYMFLLCFNSQWTWKLFILHSLFRVSRNCVGYYRLTFFNRAHEELYCSIKYLMPWKFFSCNYLFLNILYNLYKFTDAFCLIRGRNFGNFAHPLKYLKCLHSAFRTFDCYQAFNKFESANISAYEQKKS